MGFQSTRPLRGATRYCAALILPSAFQSTRPLRGATTVKHGKIPLDDISIHAPLAGRDHLQQQLVALVAHVISIHAPLAGRDIPPRRKPGALGEFQSTRPLRGATVKLKAYVDLGFISIHAPLAGRDRKDQTTIRSATEKISIHAPLAGRDSIALSMISNIFYFNPRAPCGARLCLSSMDPCMSIFQSTRPLRGATRLRVDVQAL